MLRKGTSEAAHQWRQVDLLCDGVSWTFFRFWDIMFFEKKPFDPYVLRQFVAEKKMIWSITRFEQFDQINFKSDKHLVNVT